MLGGRRERGTVAALGGLALALGAIGCAGDGQTERTRLAAADFAGAGEPALPAPARRPVVGLTERDARGGVDDVEVVIGAPESGPDESLGGEDLGDRIVIDQMVGQVNGVPIYAGEFFSTMEARLRAEAKRLEFRPWVAMVRENVALTLRGRLVDEALWLEFYSSVEPAQRQGLLNVLADIRASMRRNAGGSAEQANERALEQAGMTLDQAAREAFDRQVIEEQLRRAIESKVHISRKDIERRYREDFEKYNPPAVAVMRVIQIPASDVDAVERIDEALAAGVPFEEVARQESRYRPDNDHIEDAPIRGSLAETRLWGVPELNEPSRALEPGEHTERIRRGTSFWWIKMEEIRRPPARSFYEVQHQIESELRSEQQLAERVRYLNRVLRGANMTDREEMERRLVEYAVRQFYVAPENGEEAPG